MFFKRYGKFAGGIDLPEEKGGLLDNPISPVATGLQAAIKHGLETATPDRLLVPLAPCGGAPARPVASLGQRVKQGQKLAEAPDGQGVDVFAPLSGRVAGTGSAAVAGEEGFLACEAIELTELEGAVNVAEAEPVFDWQAADQAALLERLESGALATYRPPVQPLSIWMRRAREARCDTLVANVVEGQPYVASDHRLLAEFGREVVEGLAMLGQAIGALRLILAVDVRRTDYYRGVIAPARDHNVSRIAIPYKYPAGADAILVKLLTRRQTPPGGGTMAVGVAVIGAAACFAAWRWVACRQAPTHRVVTVAGEGVPRAGNYWAPFGISCAALAGAPDGTVHGGPMTGLRCVSHSVVSPATDAVLRIVQGDCSAPSPCIRCGWCADHCPGRLNVAALNDCFELGLVEQAGGAGVMACVECGVCAYVCPARLPLSHRVRRLKKALAAISETSPV